MKWLYAKNTVWQYCLRVVRQRIDNARKSGAASLDSEKKVCVCCWDSLLEYFLVGEARS